MVLDEIDSCIIPTFSLFMLIYYSYFSHLTHNFISIHVCHFFPAGLFIHACHSLHALPTCILHVFACFMTFPPSCWSISACSSFDSFLHCRCASHLSNVCCSIHACHSFHAFGSLTLCPFIFACYFMQAPMFLLIFYMLFCDTLPNSAAIHMAHLCEYLMAWASFGPQLRQSHLLHYDLLLFAFLCHSSHGYFM